MRRQDSEIDLSAPCAHVAQVTVRDVKRPGDVCPDCVAIGGEWVHLRECLVCGHIGCCDESPNQHATKHFHKTKHAVMTSLEPRETWAWCFIDELILSK
jgi:uncharacterized UBP type Zn finger protein